MSEIEKVAGIGDPTDIDECPDDIKRAAQTAWEWVDAYLGGDTSDPGYSIERALMRERRNATLAERARCCSIATKPHPHDARRPFWSQGPSIAQAIRNGPKCARSKGLEKANGPDFNDARAGA